MSRAEIAQAEARGRENALAEVAAYVETYMTLHFDDDAAEGPACVSVDDMLTHFGVGKHDDDCCRDCGSDHIFMDFTNPDNSAVTPCGGCTCSEVAS